MRFRRPAVFQRVAANALRLFPALFALAALAARVAAAEVAFTITDDKNAPVADAVVSLVPLDAPAKFSPPAAPIEIAQAGQEFSFFVTPVVVGTTVVFPNDDKVNHQVYSLSPTKKFALPLYKPGSSGTVVFERAGVVALGCNIHDWMLAYIVVLETPWFAKTTANGAAKIEAPPGRYRAEVWHPRAARSEQRDLSLSDGAAPVQTFTIPLKPERRIRRTPEARGRGYE